LPQELSTDDIWNYRVYLSRFVDKQRKKLVKNYPKLLFNRFAGAFKLFYGKRYSLPSGQIK